MAKSAINEVFASVDHLDGLGALGQAPAVHLLHRGAGLRRLGELHKRHSFRLFRVLVLHHPDVLDLAERGEVFSDDLLGYGLTGDEKQTAVRRLVQVRGGAVGFVHSHGSDFYY